MGESVEVKLNGRYHMDGWMWGVTVISGYHFNEKGYIDVVDLHERFGDNLDDVPKTFMAKYNPRTQIAVPV